MANGQLDTRTLAQIDGEPGDLLRADACGYWNALQRDFRKAMGYGLGVREAYRPLATQIAYFVTRYAKTSRNTGLWYDGTYWVKKAGVPAAARPGTSKHGDGLAVDATIDSFTSPAYRWMAANADRYGFGNNQGRNDGEPWHWVFGETRPTIQPASVGSQAIDNDGNDMADITEGQMQRIAVILLDTEIQTPLGPRLVKHALGDALLLGQANANSIAEVPDLTWDVRLEHTLAKAADGSPLMVPVRDLVRYEPAEHEATRRAVAAVARPDVDLDYAAVVAELKESGLDPATFATYAADEADRRERERLTPA
ncbi:M15 family metallopeptidase [Clavibacter sp. VKM Ac-2872]|uniref:M15 family metallopeptidase n=1 Tax=Clavibacter sp. VKM Ac-2872 TaxID=2783812 RepID=UPI001889FED5|nr:M15 family metallopeptidase [Clavibacter sp. VKM Ac-2872]MBF4625530.1 M15 family metallopeptidase [Clavibacter sp. VKM Ac-2872]